MTDHKQLLTEKIQPLIELIDKGDTKSILSIAQRLFKEEPQNENLLAWVAGNLFHNNIPGCEKLIAEFVDRFPSSLHPIRPYLGAILLTQNQFDSASNEARIYLHTVNKAGLFATPEKIAKDTLLDEGVGQAFLQLTSVYTEAGARSYSKRALEYGSQFVSDYWKDIYANELNTIEKELQEKKVRKLDAQWEEFFQSGKHMQKIIKLCKEKGCTALEKRVGLIEGKFRYDANYKVDESELFQVIFGKDDTFGLL